MNFSDTLSTLMTPKLILVRLLCCYHLSKHKHFYHSTVIEFSAGWYKPLRLIRAAKRSN